VGAQRRRATDGETVRCEQRPTCLCIAWGWCMARRAEPSLARIACGGAQPCNCRHRHHGRSGPTRPPETCICRVRRRRRGRATQWRNGATGVVRPEITFLYHPSQIIVIQRSMRKRLAERVQTHTAQTAQTSRSPAGRRPSLSRSGRAPRAAVGVAPRRHGGESGGSGYTRTNRGEKAQAQSPWYPGQWSLTPYIRR